MASISQVWPFSRFRHLQILRRDQDSVAAVGVLFGLGTAALTVVEGTFTALHPAAYAVFGALVLVNTSVFFDRRFEELCRRLTTILFLFNVLCLTAFLPLAGLSSTDWQIALCLVVVMAALGQSLWAVVVATATVAIVYGFLQRDLPVGELLLNPAFFLRVTFFFITGLFVGHLAETTRREDRTRARLDEVSALNEKLATLNRGLEEARSGMEELVRQDPLTGMPNRRGLERFLELERERALATKSRLTVLLVDVDEFKRVNERLGHAVGDIILKSVAQRVRATLRTTDHLARIGGDEFLALLPGSSLECGAQIAERVRLAVAETQIEMPGGTMRVTVSIGVAEISADAPCLLNEAMTRSDLALRRSKEEGRNRVYQAASARGVGGHGSDLIPKLVETLRGGGDLSVVLQPILRLEDEEVVGYELLSRGFPGGFEMPSDFFRVCSENNILTMVDFHCLRNCLDLAAGLDPASWFHINVFPSTLLEVSAEHILDAFPPGLSPDRVCLELNEKQLIGDAQDLVESLEALRAAGVRFALDDVGYGRSYLEGLLILEPEVIKIDRRCIDGIAGSPEQRAVLERLLRMLRPLDAHLVAEGIEDPADLAVLRRLGVPFGQGFLWGRPGAAPTDQPAAAVS